MSTTTTRTGASSFVSAQLKSAITALEPTLMSYKSTVDALCADIVAVERFLQERLVMVNVSMGTGITNSGPDEEREDEIFFLRWTEDDFGKFRLFYTLEKELDFDTFDLIEKKPLAEAPLYLRIQLVSQLPGFLEVVGRELQRWQKEYRAKVQAQPQFDEEDLPF